ncbi:hypothetical protein A3H89_01355 [Candidatus Amesbacteria bacterium RIFCSPLOWO2_02_FULL_48_11]|uniref:Uncharacterized protein n=1 Tax=Candidatus Amesbacteria bacterium GW2011_GWA2_47_11 TaxID=1618357 RepID=A0A0G1TQK9_9BACT|nr:MAG: hypothetical protein UX78_C0008G0027 [Candidatus Amesbacteria bacterium GW2011_GWA2_47_11]OGD05363.1 MAG: hypothetical protein A3H89_01355 [Candidatus Amesbacteria bacterium RIFCSPLOWO2_02_FULL_48_11]
MALKAIRRTVRVVPIVGDRVYNIYLNVGGVETFAAVAYVVAGGAGINWTGDRQGVPVESLEEDIRFALGEPGSGRRR